MQIHPMAIRYLELLQDIRHSHGIVRSAYNTSKLKPLPPIQTLKTYLKRFRIRQQKVVITGLARSGTGSIHSILNNHSNHRVFGELFDPVKGQQLSKHQKLAEQLARNHPFQLIGFKLLLYQVPEYEETLTALINKDWKIIGTLRNEPKKQALSYYLAAALDFYHHNERSKLPTDPIKVNIDFLKRLIEIFEKSNADLLTHYNNLGSTVHIINFSEIKTEVILREKLSSILKIPCTHLIPSEKKTLPDQWALIKNSDDVKRIILQD